LWCLTSWLVGHVDGDSRRLVTLSFGNSTDRTDFAVLAGVEQYGPLSQALLGRRLGVNLGDMVAVLKRLEARGLVVRGDDEQDRRRNSIGITEAGKKALISLEGTALAAQDELLKPLSQEERQQLVGLLQTLVKHHRNYLPPKDVR
jgi:DNA-binding MarR family transcriptional regulator